MAGYRVRAAEPGDCEEILRMIQRRVAAGRRHHGGLGQKEKKRERERLRSEKSPELADYEKLSDQVKNTAEGLRRDGFEEPSPLFRCLVVENEEKPETGPRLVGYALSFFTYSTWEGRSLHLEDIYVMPDYRGKGIGSKLFAAVAEFCLSLGCARLQLSVLDWNQSAISFYRSRGARDLSKEEGWRLLRFLPGDLQRITCNNSS